MFSSALISWGKLHFHRSLCSEGRSLPWHLRGISATRRWSWRTQDTSELRVARVPLRLGVGFGNASTPFRFEGISRTTDVRVSLPLVTSLFVRCFVASDPSEKASAEHPLSLSLFAQFKDSHRRLPLSQTLPLLKPFLIAQWRLIFKAWICTLASVVALFYFVPQTGIIYSILGNGDLQNLSRTCTFATFLLAVRSVAKFLQQSLLWEVALRVTYDIRCYVFKRVIQNDTAYFESRSSAASGDLAYRITVEAQDTGDSVYALLEVHVARDSRSSLQGG